MTTRRAHTLKRRREVSDLALGRRAALHKCVARMQVRAGDGHVRELRLSINVTIVNTDLNQARKVLELYGREIGMGFDGSTTKPDEREVLENSRIVNMTPAAIRAMALRLADDQEAAERRAKKKSPA